MTNGGLDSGRVVFAGGPRTRQSLPVKMPSSVAREPDRNGGARILDVGIRGARATGLRGRLGRVGDPTNLIPGNAGEGSEHRSPSTIPSESRGGSSARA